MKSLLPKHRVLQMFELAPESLDSGKRACVGWASATVRYPDGATISPCFPVIQMQFYQFIGMIVCNWSVFESILDEMTQLLLDYQGKSETSWRKTLSYKERLTLHRKCFRSVFSAYSSIKQYHHEIIGLVVEPKKVRDGISHALPAQGLHAGVHSLSFIETNMRLPTEKRYDCDDLYKIGVEINHASGFLEGLAIADPESLPFSSREISALQQVFGRDRWIEANLRALKIRPQPSPR